MLFAPEVEKSSVAEGDVLGAVDAEARGRLVDPRGRSFELGKVSNRRLVNHAVAIPGGPLGAPLLVAEGGYQVEGSEDLGKCFAVADLGFCLDAVLMAVFAGTCIGQALMRQGPASRVTPDAQDLGACAHLPVRRVVEGIGLECARGLQLEPGSLQAVGKPGKVVDAELDLSFDGHGKERVYGRWRHPTSRSENGRVHTLRLTIETGRLDTAGAEETLDRAAAILQAGGLVALPTETVYGLGANALDEGAVRRIFAAKQRPSWDPVIMHIADQAMLAGLVSDVPEAARRLMNAFWPGPLTLLLPRTGAVPDIVTAGRPLVGVRMPAHPVALELIRRAGVPVAAPSANLFSRTSPTSADHVLADLDGLIDAVVDAGPTLHGLESTVLDPCQSPMILYRPGAITVAQIEAVAGEVRIFEPSSDDFNAASQRALPSPGVGLRHYAPRARLVLIDAHRSQLQAELERAAEAHCEEKIGVMLPRGIDAPAGVSIFPWGDWESPDELGQRLFAGLRQLDAEGCGIILCPIPTGEGIGAAIGDRLRKAARTE